MKRTAFAMGIGNWELGQGLGTWSLGSEYTLLDIFTLLQVYIGPHFGYK
jgi:glutathione S-transferase